MQPATIPAHMHRKKREDRNVKTADWGIGKPHNIRVSADHHALLKKMAHTGDRRTIDRVLQDIIAAYMGTLQAPVRDNLEGKETP